MTNIRVMLINAEYRSKLPKGVTVYDTKTSNEVLKPCALQIT